jgi:hypothetical protein
MRRIRIALVCVLVVTVAFLLYHFTPHQGSLVETVVLARAPFELRVRAYSEVGTIVPGGYFYFESKLPRESEWRPALTFRHDDMPQDRPYAGAIVNGQTGYVHSGWTYAVTTDSGKTWNRWDASRDLLGWRCCNYSLIDSVRLESSGRGTMYLGLIESTPHTVARLHTLDFGRHWQREPAGASDALR